ncbi:hypothetical protein NIIDNTM18_02130 [Mycolicibacterium litorale]|uniref:Uncharacterized protein n=1 Tax=Mycolicibacterium litorale TaxID=758802 RepID=A0A6S6NY62_9MYCO|nr:hypothetical protein NIIDNTM18_02130 [Mycolicibacterium litorale]
MVIVALLVEQLPHGPTSRGLPLPDDTTVGAREWLPWTNETHRIYRIAPLAGVSEQLMKASGRS